MKLWIALALAVLLAAVASYGAVQGFQEAQRYRRTVEGLEAQLRASQEATARAMRQAAEVHTASQAARTALEDKLNEHPEWSAGPVPRSVRDGLCSTIRCTESGTVSAPGSKR